MATEQKYNTQLVAHLAKRTAEHGPDSIWAKMLVKAQAHQEGRNLINEELAKPSASWVIVDKTSGKAVFETFTRTIADKVNTASYRVVPILEWLHSLNHA